MGYTRGEEHTLVVVWGVLMRADDDDDEIM